MTVNEYVQELQAEGQVIVDDFNLAQQILEASFALIGKCGVFGIKVHKVRLVAALPAFDAGRAGYKVVTL